MCKDGVTCISKGWRCDREKDCPDGSDEEPDVCKSFKKTKFKHSNILYPDTVGLLRSLIVMSLLHLTFTAE